MGTKSEGKQASGQQPRPRRKKMVAMGVEAMKQMIMPASTTAVALPESPTPTLVSRKHEREGGEQRDDLESVFNHIRATSNRKVLAFDLSAPAMPDMLSMPALPTPDVNRTSKLQNEMSNSNNADAPMKKQ